MFISIRNNTAISRFSVTVFVHATSAPVQLRGHGGRRRPGRAAFQVRRRPHPLLRHAADFEVRTHFEKNFVSAVDPDAVPGGHRGRNEADVGGEARQAHVEAGAGGCIPLSPEW